MDWKDVVSAVGKVAPILGTVIGGPVGAIAGKGISLIADLFGCEETPDAITAAMSANPEAMLKLKQLENEHQVVLIEWQKVQLQAELANVTNARDREVKMTQAGSLMGALPPAIVSLVVTIGFFVMLHTVLTMPEKPSESAILLLGTLATAFIAVVNYYLGSSLGSFRKTEQQTVTKGVGK